MAVSADPAVVGRTLTLNRQPFTVIGVTEAGFVGTELRRPGLWLPLIGLVSLVCAGLIVLMACLNIMNLLLARAPSRQRGVRIRLSLGAGRRRILRQLLTESVLLAVIGGAAALALAWLASRLLIARLPMGGLVPDLSLDVRVLAYAFVACLSAAALFGIAPALEATRVDLASAMRGDSAAAGAERAYRDCDRRWWRRSSPAPYCFSCSPGCS